MRLSSFAYIARALRCKNTGCFLAKPYAEAHGNRANSLKFKMKKMRSVTLSYGEDRAERKENNGKYAFCRIHLIAYRQNCNVSKISKFQAVDNRNPAKESESTEKLPKVSKKIHLRVIKWKIICQTRKVRWQKIPKLGSSAKSGSIKKKIGISTSSPQSAHMTSSAVRTLNFQFSDRVATLRKKHTSTCNRYIELAEEFGTRRMIMSTNPFLYVGLFVPPFSMKTGCLETGLLPALLPTTPQSQPNCQFDISRRVPSISSRCTLRTLHA